MSEYEPLYKRFLDRRCSREEAELLFQYFRTVEGDAELVRLIEVRLDEWPDGTALTADDHAAISRNANRLDEALSPKSRRIAKWLPYAAAILLVASVVGWWAISHQQSAVSLTATEILPGGNKATLTLADGRVVDLSEEQEGISVADGITYLDGTEVIENGKWKVENEGPTFNSIRTPKGGTYQITLPDGSKVWLNSASTLNYPNRFPANERIVELIGEGYFEIEKDSKRPFKVRSKGQTVDVLGTQFNISAYAEDPDTKTTLVEGKIKVFADGMDAAPVLLSPGEQAKTRETQTTKLTVDVEQYVSWKAGYFKLDGTLAGIMAQVSRWYDVEVSFAKGVDQHMELAGQISRSAKLSDLLWMINEIDPGLKFKVEEQHTETNRERRLLIMR